MTPVLGTFSAASVRGFRGFQEKQPIKFVGQTADIGYLTSNSTYTVSLTSLTNGIDSAPRTGDLVVVLTGWTSAENVNGNPGVTTSGYTELYDLYTSGNGSVYSTNMSVNWKIMGATPDTSVTCYARGATYDVSPYPLSFTQILVFRNIDQTTPLGSTANATNFGNNIDPPAVTPTKAGSWIVHLAFLNGSCNATKPSDMTQEFTISIFNNVSPSPYVYMALRCAYKSDWTSGTFDPIAWGTAIIDNTRSYCVATITLNPT